MMLSKSKIKYIQSLGHKKFRDEHAVFVAEGPKIVNELLQQKILTAVEIFAVQDWVDHHKTTLPGVALQPVSIEELQKLTQLSTANQVLAVFKMPPPVKAIETKKQIVLMLDGIQDPGNLGTIIRIADWFGIGQLVCSRECADVYNPKVIQASMASIGRVSIMYTDLLQWIADHPGTRLFAAALDGENINSMEPLKEGVMVIGNESKGIQPAIMERAQARITIPRIGHAESLNAAVATGIILSRLVK